MTWEWPSSLGWAVPVPEDFDPEADVRQALDAAIGAVRGRTPRRRPWKRRVVGGPPGPVLVEASKGADLLVVGQPRPR